MLNLGKAAATPRLLGCDPALYLVQRFDLRGSTMDACLELEDPSALLPQVAPLGIEPHDPG